MKAKVNAIIKLTLVLFLSTMPALAREFSPLNVMHSSGSVVNATFFDAGAAFPTSPVSMSVNPAMPAAWHFFTHSGLAVFGTYMFGRNDNFLQTGGGASLAIGPGQNIGIKYNLVRRPEEDHGLGSRNNRLNRATISYGMLVDEGVDDALFAGISISYFNTQRRITRAAQISERGNLVRTNDINAETSFANENNHLISADIGFYQAGDGEGLSWGIVLENILGYWWNKTDGERRSAMLNRRYNSFLLATCLSVPMMGGELLLLVPLDVRFWGFMNRDLRRGTRLRYRSEVHSGFELKLSSGLSGRFGWAWSPNEHKTNEAGQLDFQKWNNNFRFGVGFNRSIFGADIMFSRNLFGASLSLFL